MSRICVQKAFTMVEIAAVLVVMAILLTVAMPRYASFIQTDRLTRAAARVSTDLRIAQAEAIKSQRYVTVQFYVAESAYRTIFASDGALVPGPKSVRLAESTYRVSLVSAGFSGEAEAVFDRFGMPLAGGNVVIGINDLQITVTLDGASGRVSTGPIQRTVTPLAIPDAAPRSIIFPLRKFIPL